MPDKIPFGNNPDFSSDSISDIPEPPKRYDQLKEDIKQRTGKTPAELLREIQDITLGELKKVNLKFSGKDPEEIIDDKQKSDIDEHTSDDTQNTNLQGTPITATRKDILKIIQNPGNRGKIVNITTGKADDQKNKSSDEPDTKTFHIEIEKSAFSETEEKKEEDDDETSSSKKILPGAKKWKEVAEGSSGTMVIELKLRPKKGTEASIFLTKDDEPIPLKKIPQISKTSVKKTDSEKEVLIRTDKWTKIIRKVTTAIPKIDRKSGIAHQDSVKKTETRSSFYVTPIPATVKEKEPKGDQNITITNESIDPATMMVMVECVNFNTNDLEALKNSLLTDKFLNPDAREKILLDSLISPSEIGTLIFYVLCAHYPLEKFRFKTTPNGENDRNDEKKSETIKISASTTKKLYINTNDFYPREIIDFFKKYKEQLAIIIGFWLTEKHIDLSEKIKTLDETYSPEPKKSVTSEEKTYIVDGTQMKVYGNLRNELLCLTLNEKEMPLAESLIHPTYLEFLILFIAEIDAEKTFFNKLEQSGITKKEAPPEVGGNMYKIGEKFYTKSTIINIVRKIWNTKTIQELVEEKKISHSLETAYRKNLPTMPSRLLAQLITATITKQTDSKQFFEHRKHILTCENTTLRHILDVISTFFPKKEIFQSLQASIQNYAKDIEIDDVHGLFDQCMTGAKNYFLIGCLQVLLPELKPVQLNKQLDEKTIRKYLSDKKIQQITAAISKQIGVERILEAV